MCPPLFRHKILPAVQGLVSDVAFFDMISAAMSETPTRQSAPSATKSPVPENSLVSITGKQSAETEKPHMMAAKFGPTYYRPK